MGVRSGLQYQVWIPSCEAGLKSNQRTTGCCHKLCATVVPMATSCLAGQQKSSPLAGTMISAWYLLTLRNSSRREDLFTSVPGWFFHDWTNVSSSAIGFCHIVGNQEQQQWPVLFYRPLGPPWLIIYREIAYTWYWDFCLITHVFWEKCVPLTKSIWVQTPLKNKEFSGTIYKLWTIYGKNEENRNVGV